MYIHTALLHFIQYIDRYYNQWTKARGPSRLGIPYEISKWALTVFLEIFLYFWNISVFQLYFRISVCISVIFTVFPYMYRLCPYFVSAREHNNYYAMNLINYFR